MCRSIDGRPADWIPVNSVKGPNKRAASNGFKIKVNREDARIVRRIFNLFVSGIASPAITRDTNARSDGLQHPFERFSQTNGIAASGDSISGAG